MAIAVLWSTVEFSLELKLPKFGRFSIPVGRIQNQIIFTAEKNLPFLPSTQIEISLTPKNTCQAMQGAHPRSRQEAMTLCSL